MLKILIADDHEFIRKGVRQLLTDEFSPVYIIEAEDTNKLLELAPTEEWDIIISDISMPGKGGIDALCTLKKQQPHIPVLMLSIYPKDQYADNVIAAGAAGYLNKDSDPAELVHTVKLILKKREETEKK